jgi:hypothetical protein
MVSALTLSSDTRTTAGILLLTIVAVEYGGLTVVTNVLARDGIWAAAILFPAGFFLSSAGRAATQPNRLILLVYAGAVALPAGVLALRHRASDA